MSDPSELDSVKPPAAGQKDQQLVILLDQQLIPIWVNANFAEISGISSQEIFSYSLERLINKFFKAAEVQKILRALKLAVTKDQVVELNQLKGSDFLNLNGLQSQFQLIFRPGISYDQQQEYYELVISADLQVDQKLASTSLAAINVFAQGDLIFLRSNLNLEIIDIFGDTDRILGLRAEDLIKKPQLWWEVVYADDYKRINRAFYKIVKKPQSFTREVRFSHFITKETKWMLFSAVPYYENEKLAGWEGYGLEITQQKKAENNLDSERQHWNMLYKLSSNIKDEHSPEKIALNGIASMMQRFSFSSGVIWNIGADENIELAAAQGLTKEVIHQLDHYQIPTELKDQLEKEQLTLTGECLRGDNCFGLNFLVEELPRFNVYPIYNSASNREKILTGIIILGGEQTAELSPDIEQKLNAMLAEIGRSLGDHNRQVATNQAATNTRTLFDLSKQLSRSFALDEIADAAFSILDRVIPHKRAWFGTSNSSGTHIIGLKGVGPGMGSDVNFMQIELSRVHNYLDQSIKAQKSSMFKYDRELICSGVAKTLNKFNPEHLLILPLVTMQQVLGVIVLEPNSQGVSQYERRISLLANLSEEVASAMMSRQLKEKVTKAEKLKMANLLVSGIAHNFNNLLQVIVGQASLIEVSKDAGEPVRVHAKAINKAATKGADLIKKMMFLSDVSVPQLSKLELGNFLQKHIEELQFKYREQDVALRLHKETEGEIYINADFYHLQELINAIIDNSVDAIRDRETKKEVLVDLRLQELASGEVSYELAPGRYAQIAVKDYGIGMDSEQIKNCFDPFYSTKSTDLHSGVGFSGSGLGLSHAAQIAQSLNGIITVESKVGVGSTFIIYLPLRAD